MTDYNEVAIFVQIVDCGSFSAAARKLKLPVTNISRKLSQLEDRLGQRLLNRTTRKMSLTEAGKIYYEHCRTIADMVQGANNALTHAQEEPQGLLRIGSTIAFTEAILNQALIDFLAKYPKVTLEVLTQNTQVNIIDAAIDATFRIGDLIDESMMAIALGNIDYVLCASNKYLEAAPTIKTPDDITQHQTVGLSQNIMKPWRFYKKNQEELVKPNHKILYNDISLAAYAVSQGVGLGYLPWVCVRPYVEMGKISILMNDWSAISRPVHLIYPSKRNLSRNMRSFIDIVVPQIRDSLAARQIHD